MRRRGLALLCLGAACARVLVVPPAPREHAVPAVFAPTGPPRGAFNPDVTPATLRATICQPGWTASIRPPTRYTTALKLAQLQRAGATVDDPAATCPPHSSNPRCYEEDHLVPLELGGAPFDPDNLWPEPYDDIAGCGARQKDWVEGYLHRAVCDGSWTLPDAQRAIVGDWCAVYQAHHETISVAAPTPPAPHRPRSPVGCDRGLRERSPAPPRRGPP